MTSKAEYLKRYLSGDDEKKKAKKKKRKGASSGTRSRLVDDDVSWTPASSVPISIRLKDEEDDEPLGEDEKPIVAGFVDEGKEERERRLWRPMTAEERRLEDLKSANLDDMSPPRKRRTRHDSGSDQSPPRRRKRHDSDESPPRRRGRQRSRDSDESPPRRRARSRDSDESPPRRPMQRRDSDESPPRRRRQRRDSSPSSKRKRSISSPQREEKRRQMTSGGKAGLQSSSTMRDEIRQARKREEEMFHQMDASVSGKGAATVFRDKEGRRVDPRLERMKQRKKEEKEAEHLEKYAQWGRGVAQAKMKEKEIDDMIHEMSKPLARYKDDKDLDKMLRDTERSGDPMLAFIKKRKATTGRKIPERPTWKGHYPPNRFDIRPGYRWDGVDRSNGFEKERYRTLSNKQAWNDEAYKWSVEDM